MPVGLYAGANVSNGNGVTTLFPYNFKILDQTHIEVKVDGVVMVLGADYAVTGVGLSNGGNVVFTVAPANGAVVQRARKVPYKRDTDYQANGDLREDTLDPDLDIEEMQIQQLAADIARAFKAPLAVTADQVLSDAMWAARANMLLGFDGAGGFGVFAALNQALVSAFMATVLDDADAPTARTTLGLALANKGGLLTGRGANVVGEKAAGTDGYTLLAESGSADGLLYVPPAFGSPIINGYIAESRAGNAATFAIKRWDGNDPSAAQPVYVIVRDATAGTGLPKIAKITAATSFTFSSGSTAGARNGIPFRIWLVLFDDAGVYRLGAINCVTTVAGAGAGSDVTAIYPLKGWGIASSTAEGGAGAADNAQTFYTGAAVAAKAFTTLGYATYEAGLAAAGTWGIAPARIQPFLVGTPLPGDVIQVVRTQTGAVATGTTEIPNDDTIPQSTEGDQYISQAITPTSAANVLRTQATLHGACSLASTTAMMALFQDATANALAVCEMPYTTPNANARFLAQIRNMILAAVSVATTLKVRFGAVTGTAGTNTINGAATARLFGGTIASYMEIEEIMG